MFMEFFFCLFYTGVLVYIIVLGLLSIICGVSLVFISGSKVALGKLT